MDHMINFHEEVDGSIPADKWITVSAKNKDAALLKAMKRVCVNGFHPPKAFVSIGSLRHDNGRPVAVQAYRLEWQAKEP